MGCMRTNIVLNDELVEEAMQYSKSRTRRALVEEALATYVAVKAEERRRATYRERLLGLQGQLNAVRLRESPADVLRTDRERP
jgi:Arc/MetJ family transcription regulator